MTVQPPTLPGGNQALGLAWTIPVLLLVYIGIGFWLGGLLGSRMVGVLVGYIYACVRGQVDFKPVQEAAWIGFPQFHLPQADFSILPMFLLYLFGQRYFVEGMVGSGLKA